MRKLEAAFLEKGVTLLCSATVIIMLATSLLAVSARADYAISIAQGNVSVDIAGEFVQGVQLPTINDTSIFAGIPVFSSRLQGTNTSVLAAGLSDAIRAKASSARVTGVKFSADSNGTRMLYELSFNVADASTTTNGLETVDLSWRNFAIEGDFGANGVSINRIVPNYVYTNILGLAQPTPSPTGIQEVKSWYLDHRSILASRVPAETVGLTLFNFSSLAQPLGEWSIQRDLSKSQVLLQSSTGFNLTYVVRITEAETTSYIAFDAINNLKVSIQAPLPLQITDNSLVFDTGAASWKPQLMLASIGAGLALLIGTYLVEKRIKPSLRSRQKKIKR